MIAGPYDDRDGVLTGALADLIARLRGAPYQGVIDEVQKACSGTADEFIGKLADHLRNEEDVLFPAILRADPGAAREVEALLGEHRRLRAYAVRLARRIRGRDAREAGQVARRFLAALYDHIDHERRVVEPRLGGVALAAPVSG
jgi:hemerythrin-like domain-containing protein